MRYLGEILVELGYVTQEKIDEILEEQRQKRNSNFLLGELLVEREIITQKQLTNALQTSLKDIIEDTETKNFIKEAAEISLENLKTSNLEDISDNKLSEEGHTALAMRLRTYENQMSNIKTQLQNSQKLKMTPFRQSAILNYKQQLIDLEKKIQQLRRDIDIFC